MVKAAGETFDITGRAECDIMSNLSHLSCLARCEAGGRRRRAGIGELGSGVDLQILSDCWTIVRT